MEGKEDFKEGLKSLTEPGLEALIKDLTASIIAVNSMYKDAKIRLSETRWKLRAAVIELKRHRVYLTAKSIKLSEYRVGPFVCYNAGFLFRHGVYPAKDPKCPWRVVSSVNGRSAKALLFRLRHESASTTEDIYQRAQQMGLEDVRHAYRFVLHTASMHSAICLIRMGMKLHYMRALMPTVKTFWRLKLKRNHRYTLNYISRAFCMVRKADESPLGEFPRTLWPKAGGRISADYSLTDPEVYPDCRFL